MIETILYKRYNKFEKMTLFEKMVVLLLIMFLFILFGVGSYYFKRRIHNMEVAIKDQASVTHNILGMMNTFTRSSTYKQPSEENDAHIHLNNKELSSDNDNIMQSISSFHENPSTMAISDIIMGTTDYNSGASYMKMGGIELMGMCSLGSGMYSSTLNKGKIVVTDSDDDANIDVIEELNIDNTEAVSITEDDARLSDIDAEEPDTNEPINGQNPNTVTDSKESEPEAIDDLKTHMPSASYSVSNSDAHTDVIKNDTTHVSYDKMKVNELRELLESKGHSMTKMKQLKKAELIQLATSNIAPAKETCSMTLDLSESLSPSHESLMPVTTEESLMPVTTREVEE